MTFKETIETILGAHGQTELARIMGVDDRTVRRWIAGKAPERAWYALHHAAEEKITELGKLKQEVNSKITLGGKK